MTVYSKVRTVECPAIELPAHLDLNARLKMDGRLLLFHIPENTIPVVFFDPQYRGVLDKLQYGNEGEHRGRRRCLLNPMDNAAIKVFIQKIEQVLIPSGHLFLWIDKFHLCQGFLDWLENTELAVVDLITWNKKKMGMGYRTRRCAEYLVVLQAPPKKAKGVWKLHDIRDVWEEGIDTAIHVHRKPVELQRRLILATSNEGDIIVDPAAGSFSVMDAVEGTGRNFLGCDING